MQNILSAEELRLPKEAQPKTRSALYPCIRKAGLDWTKLTNSMTDLELVHVERWCRWALENDRRAMPAAATDLFDYRMSFQSLTDGERETLYSAVIQAHAIIGHANPVPPRVQRVDLGGLYLDQMSDSPEGRERRRLGLPEHGE